MGSAVAGSVAVSIRAGYRGYVQGGKRSSRVTRLHIVRDLKPWENLPGPRYWCGQSAWPHHRSEPVILDPAPLSPPAGLSWCPSCIGHLAEHLGLLDDVAGEVVSYDPGLLDLREAKWWDFVAAQREVRRELLARGRR